MFPRFLEKGSENAEKYYKNTAKLFFSKFGSEWDLSDSLFDTLEEFECNLYGYSETNINKVRWLLFQKKHATEMKTIDLSVLLPCHDALRLHSARANFVVKVWRFSLKKKIDEESFTNNGWVANGNI